MWLRLMWLLLAVMGLLRLAHTKLGLAVSLGEGDALLPLLLLSLVLLLLLLVMVVLWGSVMGEHRGLMLRATETDKEGGMADEWR